MSTKKPIGWRRQVEKKKGNVSRFLLTINTNSTDEKVRDLLKAATEVFYDKIDYFVKHRYSGVGHNDIVGLLDTFEIDPVIEVGKKYHRIHLHALITIGHRTEIHLDVKKITAFFSKSIGVGNIHLDVKYIRDPEFTVRRYIEKDFKD